MNDQIEFLVSLHNEEMCSAILAVYGELRSEFGSDNYRLFASAVTIIVTRDIPGIDIFGIALKLSINEHEIPNILSDFGRYKVSCRMVAEIITKCVDVPLFKSSQYGKALKLIAETNLTLWQIFYNIHPQRKNFAKIERE